MPNPVRAMLTSILITFMAPVIQVSYAAEREISVLGPALAANAGGQIAYSARYFVSDYEASLFSNQNLLTGNIPMTGATLSRRLTFCSSLCFWRFYLQGGVGASTGGAIAQVTWGGMIPALPIWLPTRHPKYVPALRIDITTQFIASTGRVVTWNYPFWTGITIPF